MYDCTTLSIPLRPTLAKWCVSGEEIEGFAPWAPTQLTLASTGPFENSHFAGEMLIAARCL